MLDSLLKNLMQGVTLIEDDFGAVNRIISKQLGTYASNSGKKVCFLEPPEASGSNIEGGYPDNGFEIPPDHIENSGGSQTNTVIYRTEERYLPLEELKFDLIIFDSFSTYVFAMSEKEVVDLMEEIGRLAKSGKTFVLSSESPMLTDRVNAYIESAADTVIKVREEIGQNKINRWLYIPKIMNGKPYDRVVKITIEEDGVDIDTREFVG